MDETALTIRTCDGLSRAQKCVGRCKRLLPVRCFSLLTPSGNMPGRCDECATGTFKRHVKSYTEEWEF